MNYGLIVSIIASVLCSNTNLNQLNTADLHALMYVSALHDHAESVNTSALLCEFKKRTGLQVSHSDLLTYFSNLGVKFYTENA